LSRGLSCSSIYLPVNKQHPFLREGVLPFWQKNGYAITGTSNWEFSQGKTLPAYIFTKKLS
jgi:hypothetical protein